MATLADFLTNPDLKLPVRQFLPKYSRTNEAATAPQIHTLWLRAISLFRPFDLQIDDSYQAHKDLLRHLIKDEKSPTANPDHLTGGAASSPALRVISTPDEPWLTLADLRSLSQAPVALFLLLNAGLICAWRGENYIASQWFQRALAMDDRSSPANSVAVYFLLGCAQFLLRHYKSSRASFERCILHFRKLVPDLQDKGDTELSLAAPWVGAHVRTLSRSFGRADDQLCETEERKLERQRAAEKERRMEKWFRYKTFVPPEPGQGKQATSPQHGKDKGNEWREWILERTIVEGNRSVAKIRQERRENGHSGDEGEELDIAGIPGGILFWPLDDPSSPHVKTVFKTRNPTHGHPSPSKRQRHDVPPPTIQTPLPPPTWNPETQAFDPYIPPPPEPVALSHEPPATSSEASLSSPLTFDPYSIPPTYDEGTTKNDLGIVSPSDYDSSPEPDIEVAQSLKHPNSAPSFPVRGDSLSYRRANSFRTTQSTRFEQTPSALRYYLKRDNHDNNAPSDLPSSSPFFQSPDARPSILPSSTSSTSILGSTPTRGTPPDSRRKTIRHLVRRGTEEASVGVLLGATGGDVGTGRLRLERGVERKKADRHEALAALEGRRPASSDGSLGGGPSALSRIGAGVGASARSGSEGQGQRLRERMGSFSTLMRRSVSNFKRGSRASEKATDDVDTKPSTNNTETWKGHEDWKQRSVFVGGESGEEEYEVEEDTGYEEEAGYQEDAQNQKFGLLGEEESTSEEQITSPSQQEMAEPNLDDTNDLIDEILQGLGAGGLLLAKAYVPP